MNKIIFISDSSFKKEVLIDWKILDIFKAVTEDVCHLTESSVLADRLSEIFADKKDITIAYCLNFISEETSEVIEKFSKYENINQVLVVFDCFSENMRSTDLLPHISLLELLWGFRSDTIKKKNIVLLNPEGWQKESTNLGLAYIAGALKMIGFTPTIFDLNRYEMSYQQIKDRITTLNPLMIGYSAKTAVAEESAQLCEYLKNHFPDSKMVIGGPHITLCASDFLEKHSLFDAGILSEGEIALPLLALHYTAKLPIYKLENIACQKGGELIVNKFIPPQNINFPFWPDFDVIDNFSWENYRYPIVSSRGCPYGCIYCCVNKLTGDRKWRYRDPENVISEIRYIKNRYKISLFEIWDDNFTFNIERAKQICKLLIDEKLECSWWCHNGIRADKIDTELARLMKQAGCTSIALGIESGTEEVFNSINKGESLADIIRAVKIIKKAGMNIVGYFIIGLPADNLKNFIKTIDLQRSLHLDHYTFGILIPYPKTKVWDIINAKGQMLMDVTRTQHFANDIVPISFNLPSFPPQNITRAFYITKYYELFYYLNKINHATTVWIELSQEDQSHLFGLLVSLPDTPSITANCLNVTYTFTDEQNKFLENHCSIKIDFYKASLKKLRKFSDICILSKELIQRKQLIWEKFFMLDSLDPLHLIKPRWKIVEFTICMQKKNKMQLQKAFT